MRRREFITLIGGAAAWPHAGWAEVAKLATIGVLGSGFAASSTILIDAFKKGMGENGLKEGRDYVLDMRWAEADYTRFPALAAELVHRRSDRIERNFLRCICRVLA
jgi:putative tryptophan/tyrosine transport system substrate-binding protein